VAEREFRRAIELNPNYAKARHWYATFLEARARYAEAIEQIDAAERLDPASESILADKALILYGSGRLEQGRAIMRQLAEEAPSLRSVHRYHAAMDLFDGKYTEYLAEARRSAEMANDQTALAIVSAAESGFKEGGRMRMLERILEEQDRLHAQGRAQAYDMAETAALLGRTTEAVTYLEAASHETGGSFLAYPVDIYFRGIRGDARYKQLDARFYNAIGAGTIAPPH
jgi:tetratricopeptide (TPR) repeat protein